MRDIWYSLRDCHIKKNVINREDVDYIKSGTASIWFVLLFSFCVCSTSYLGGWNITNENNFLVKKISLWTWICLGFAGTGGWACYALPSFGSSMYSGWSRELDGESSVRGKYLYEDIHSVLCRFSTPYLKLCSWLKNKYYVELFNAQWNYWSE